MEAFRAEFATLTLGSGGVAMLLGRAQNDDDHRFLGTVSVAATEWVICQGQVDYMQTDSRTLLAQGVTLAQRTFTLASDVRLDVG